MSDHRPGESMHPGANFRRWLDEQRLLAELRVANGDHLNASEHEPGALGLVFLALVLPLLPKSARGELELHCVDGLINNLGDEREVYALFQRAAELLHALLTASSNPSRGLRG